MKKRLLTILLVVVAFATATRLYFRLTDDFRIANITYELPHRSQWEVSTADTLKNISAILQQPFSYLGKGSQSYAFVSADENYVLKFFKYKHLRPHWLVETLAPLPFFNDYERKQKARKSRKLEHLFAGYHLAWEQLREESGLIFIHLNPTQGVFPSIEVRDKIGLKRTINLDTVVFILQKKAETTRSILEKLLQQGEVGAAQLRLRQLLSLYASEYKRGLYDMDHGIMHNTGFVGDEPIHLDIGKLTRDERIKVPSFYRSDIAKVEARIAGWLAANYPQYKDAMVADLQKQILQLFP